MRPNTTASSDSTNTKHATTPMMPSTIAATAMPERWGGGAEYGDGPHGPAGAAAPYIGGGGGG